MNAPTTALLALALTVLPSGRAVAADLLVQPGNPLAFQTLQAALDAAQPGDRILIGASMMAGSVVVRKSVTIESVPGARYSLSQFGQFEEFRIESLTPGLPFTLCRLDLRFYEMSSAPRGIRTVGIVAGEIRMDQVDCLWSAGFGFSTWGGGAIADLRASRVWLRESRFEAHDMRSNNGCIDLDGTDGTTCLVVRADTLHMEDCFVRASSANHLVYHCCFPTGTSCSGQWPHGGRGGTALDAVTRNSVLVRCQFSDGNGGTVESNPGWIPVPTAGAAGSTMLGGQTGVLDTFAVTSEQGLAGRIGAAFTGRGTVTVQGPAAPLVLTGPVSPGTFVGVRLNTAPGTFNAFLAGLVWGETPTSLGMLWVQPFEMFLHQGGGSTHTFPIPNVLEFRGIPIYTQAVQVFPAIARMNPSGVAIR